MTDIEYQWSLGNAPKTVLVKPMPEECPEKGGMLYKGTGVKTADAADAVSCQVGR